MRRRVVAVAMALALLTAGGAVAFAVTAGITAQQPASEEPTDAAPADYCYVEAMIYYRVSESRLVTATLARDDIGEAARTFAEDTARRDDAELDDLREWYLEWRDARPAQQQADGPCTGHGTEHADMPGMPSWSRREEFAQADGPHAEQILAEILREQNEGMLAFIDLVAAGDPHPRVGSSIRDMRESVASDDPLLAALADPSR